MLLPMKLNLASYAQAAVTKEGLRMFPGVIGHPRVVPRDGAVISGTFIPGGVRFSFSLISLLEGFSLMGFRWRYADGRGPEFLLRASVATDV
jgi:hypothetical protein